MKKFLFLTLLSLLLPTSTVFAAMDIEPPSGTWSTSNPDGVVVSITCDTGNTILQYAPDTPSLNDATASCPNSFFGGPALEGTWHFIECDNTVPGAVCDTAIETYEDSLSDPGFISVEDYVVLPDPEPPIPEVAGIGLLIGTKYMVFMLSLFVPLVGMWWLKRVIFD